MKKGSSISNFREAISGRYGFVSRYLLHSPARIPIIGFAVLIIAGTFCLMLPMSSTGQRIGFTNALFTSASASCVTGLAVFDTARQLTLFGQAVLLVLIQIGGLGIMTISTLFILVAGRRPGFSDRILIQDTFTHSKERGPASIIKDVVLLTFIIEGLGMLALWARFYNDLGPLKALYYALFHSVSAFCNAGFSLFPDSFSSYRGDRVVNLVISFLVIAGGTGFLVIAELKNFVTFRHRRLNRLSLHSKLVITTTAVLLLASTVLILVLEWRNTLASLSLTERILASFFQAVSSRTAGFNTLPLGTMTNETLFFIILMMFIGACPGSCGGGVKTTTIATLTVLGISRLKGEQNPHIFSRTIPESSVSKAVSIMIISTVVVIIGTMLLLMTETRGLSHLQSRGKFLELMFETVSAFGTVGMSAGITDTLSTAGRYLITLLMFIGRLGPLVIAIAISRNESPRIQYAEENIMVG